MSTVLEWEQAWPAFPAIKRRKLETVQANLGYRCNQACSHCHVDAGPKRTEMMERDTVDLVLQFLASQGAITLDITGGAPELNPHFRHLVAQARVAGVHVIDRCNLTVLEEPGQEELAAFLAAQHVHIIASLPCYTLENVDRQRGKGVFAGSLRGIERLNREGFGCDGSGLILDFVYNPVGPRLPPDPQSLEADYKRELGRLGVCFNRLLTLTNMPINRFRHELTRTGQLDAYMGVLIDAYEQQNLERVMCRRLLSIDWRGFIYDCDFNQMLELPAGGHDRIHLNDLMNASLTGRDIAVASHCFGCTAGRGSSCSGALTEPLNKSRCV